MKKTIFIGVTALLATVLICFSTTKSVSLAAWEFIGTPNASGCIYAIVPVKVSFEVNPKGAGGSIELDTKMGTEIHCDGWSGLCTGTGCRADKKAN